jgi:hypothetical protein
MAFLTMRSTRQLIAAHGNGFRVFQPFFRAFRFATGCHRLQPRGSIKAPLLVVIRGDNQSRPISSSHARAE